MITQAIKQRITAKLRECITKAEDKYGRTFAMPAVIYTKGGAVAGTADHRKYQININPVLLMENLDDMIDNTVPHEFAHLVCYLVYPEAYKTHVRMVQSRRGLRMKRSKRDIHGTYWQSIMRVLGADPSRTHSYDVSNVSRKKARYDYRCMGCQKILQVGPKHHKRLQRDPGSVHHKTCKGHQLVPVAAVPMMPLVKPATQPQPLPAGQGTKQQQALALYRKYSAQRDRKAMIQMFIDVLGMTQAGASTYYYNCQKAA